MIEAGTLIVKILEKQNVERVFCVPGESYLSVMNGLQGKTRFDIIGAGSVHFSSSEENTYNNELDGDYRIRSAGFFENKEDAEQFVAETYSLYCSGPSAGGGARTSITKETSTASILIDRNIVEPQIKIEII